MIGKMRNSAFKQTINSGVVSTASQIGLGLFQMRSIKNGSIWLEALTKQSTKRD